MNPFRADLFAGERVLIAGASGGLGAAAAVLLSRLGAELVLIGRNEARLAETKNACANPGVHRTVCLTIDERGANPMSLAANEVLSDKSKFSGFLFAVGVELMQPIRAFAPADGKVAAQFTIGPVAFLALVSQLIRNAWLRDPASIVAVSSAAAHRGVAGMSGYSAAKAAIEAAVRSLAVELAPKVRVNAIAAGAVKTAMHDRVCKRLADGGEAYNLKHPLGIGNPEDIAQAAAFMLSAASSWMTGQTLVLDGGYSIKG